MFCIPEHTCACQTINPFNTEKPVISKCVYGCRRSVEVILERGPKYKDKPTRKIDRWIAWFGDHLLIEGSRDPEHDACRALLKIGVTGKVTFRHRGSPHPSMSMNIEKAAQLIVREDGENFYLTRHKAFSRHDVTPKKRDGGSSRYHPILNDNRASTEGSIGGAS